MPARPGVYFLQIQENLDDIEESSSDATLLFWILALVFFGMGDTVSSLLVFSQGGSELNPVMAWTMTLPGGLFAFVAAKVLALTVLFIIGHMWEGMHRWLIPVLMTVAGVYLTTSNMMTFFKMAG
jgi:hypothetical protein